MLILDDLLKYTVDSFFINSPRKKNKRNMVKFVLPCELFYSGCIIYNISSTIFCSFLVISNNFKMTLFYFKMRVFGKKNE